MQLDCFRKAIALDHADGVTLWQVILAGDALRETLVLFTADPMRICDAFWRGNMETPRWRQRSPADLRTLPVPPDADDLDGENSLRAVRALARDRFFTTSELTARGVGACLVPCEDTTLARHLSTNASEAMECPCWERASPRRVGTSCSATSLPSSTGSRTTSYACCSRLPIEHGSGRRKYGPSDRARRPQLPA
jgi:hypothetical protein